MSPFKRKRSPYWQIWPMVPGYGRVGPWSTGTKDKVKAQAIEALLKELPMRGHGRIIRMLLEGVTDVREVYVHHLEGRLPELEARATDPKIADAVGDEDDESSFISHVHDDRVRSGLRNLVRLVPAGARLSWLKEPKNVEDVLHRRQREGLKRNSVRRSLYRAISDLLDRELGSGEKTAIMAEVTFPAEKDERDVQLSPERIARLLDGIHDPRFECFVGLAVTSGVDRGPLLRIRPRHFDEGDASLEVLDRKTDARPRTLELPGPASAFLRRAIMLANAGPDDRVFPWTVHQVRGMWEAAREDAKMPWLRFKDLRSVFADHFVGAGGTLKELKEWLGHASEKTSLRYTRAQTVRMKDTAEKATSSMGFGRHLKAEEESA